MEEDTHDHQAELPASALENVLSIRRDSLDTHGSSNSQASTRSSRRICLRPAHTWALGSFLHNRHSVCFRSRDICSLGKRCGEHANCSSEKVLAAYKYQCSLAHKKVAKSKCRRKFADPLLQSPTLPPLPVLEANLMQFSVLSHQSIDGKRYVQSHREAGRGASPFTSDNLPHQGMVAGCLAQRWEGWLQIGTEKWILDI
ncbi:hypothetical protein E2C01_061856 [Portunus trituberculatus]|uniref:Uncharacterized protein n=1 Tax=Portunus trituberculatus TaxID=210409 RepID=A0A5B7HEE3_PORTR|nr:hypothetical protein [Portunus trituberculatus]